MINAEAPNLSFINLSGEYDMARISELEAALAQAHEADFAFIDLTDVPYIDSSALSSLIRLKNRMRGGGGAIRLIAPQRNIRRLLEITGIDHVVEVRENLKEALGELGYSHELANL
ncbi:MAG: STAS domain-containing protein [Candidatus Eremiobacteraeota bacterium]|nr:STAS domain-containing protein [Candidatus Eremiobacteraeota bacterium]